MSSKVKVIVHMITSIDGEVLTDGFIDEHAYPVADEYGKQGKLLGDAWGCGSGTFLTDHEVDLSKYKGVPVTYEDKPILNEQNAYTFDHFGKLRFESKEALFLGGKFVEVLTKKVAPEFLAYLDDLEIPYLFAGEEDFEPELFLQKIKDL